MLCFRVVSVLVPQGAYEDTTLAGGGGFFLSDPDSSQPTTSVTQNYESPQQMLRKGTGGTGGGKIIASFVGRDTDQILCILRCGTAIMKKR